jgi:hypothetical protein
MVHAAGDKDPREIIENVRIYRMTKELDLSSEQAIEFFPKLREFQQVEKQFQEEKTRILNSLRDNLDRGSTDKEILALLQSYEQAHRDRLTGLIEKTKEMFDILTPRQRAQYLIFQDDFNREIREMIKKVKEYKGLKP